MKNASSHPRVDVSANGQSRFIVLRDGLALQAIKAEYCEDLEFQYIMQPGFGIYLQLDDNQSLDLSFEGRPLPVGRHRRIEDRPLGFAVCREKPAMFFRRGAKGTRLCVVIVWLSPEWLAQTFGSHNWGIPRGSRGHLAISLWSPSHRVVNLAKGLFEPDTRSSAMARLRHEIVALEMASEAFGTMRPPGAEHVRRSDILLLNRACDAIEAKLVGQSSIRMLANELGISVRTLGRLFQLTYGCGVNDYIRARRMDAARNMLEEGKSIFEAATFAGYANKTNFSTAFRRRYGITPGRARSGEAAA